MPANHRRRMILVWLLLSLLLSVFLFATSQLALRQDISESVRQHLQLTVDESHFSSAEGRINDQRALQRIGEHINTALENLVTSRWYAAQKACVVHLQRIDDVIINPTPVRHSININLLRNQVERQVSLGLSCSPDWWLAAGIGGFLGLLFLVINYLFPPPLSKAHRYWINYLLERGYSGQQAFDIASSYDAPRLAINAAQSGCLEQLHDSQRQNFSWALQTITDERVAALDGAAVDWFLLGLQRDNGNLSNALALASAEDAVVIDLVEMKLWLRGLEVPMSRTPLFYYAWYALSRVNADGWITNPASNRPDLAVGQELASLMARFGGHARAINDLEQAGLKARTLDQNRSKIKDDIVAVLGEELAGAYLFEASKHPDGVHMRYRLCLDSKHIRVEV